MEEQRGWKKYIVILEATISMFAILFAVATYFYDRHEDDKATKQSIVIQTMINRDASVKMKEALKDRDGSQVLYGRYNTDIYKRNFNFIAQNTDHEMTSNFINLVSDMDIVNGLADSAVNLAIVDLDSRKN